MPDTNPTVDLGREDEFDAMQDEIDEAEYQLERAIWIDPDERFVKLKHLGRIPWRIARNLIPEDPGDGTVATAVLREVRAILEEVFARDPARMERRASRLEADGKHARAAELREQIRRVRERMAAREARRGNG